MSTPSLNVGGTTPCDGSGGRGSLPKQALFLFASWHPESGSLTSLCLPQCGSPGRPRAPTSCLQTENQEDILPALSRASRVFFKLIQT